MHPRSLAAARQAVSLSDCALQSKLDALHGVCVLPRGLLAWRTSTDVRPCTQMSISKLLVWTLGILEVHSQQAKPYTPVYRNRVPGDRSAPAARCSALRPAGCAGTHVEHLHQLTFYCICPRTASSRREQDWLAKREQRDRPPGIRNIGRSSCGRQCLHRCPCYIRARQALCFQLVLCCGPAEARWCEAEPANARRPASCYSI